MTIQELRAEPEYVSLSTKQQKAWVDAYCTNGADGMKATETAYNVTTENSARAITNRMVGDPRIKRLINRYFGLDEPDTGTFEEFLALLWSKAKVRGEEQMTALALYAKVRGWDKKPDAPAHPPETEDYVARLAAIKGE